MSEQWEQLGATPAPRVRARAAPGRRAEGSAAWTIQSAEGSETRWLIHAAHRPDLAADTWRVAVKVHQQLETENSKSSPGWFDGFEVIAGSETEALAVVEWLLAEAAA